VKLRNPLCQVAEIWHSGAYTSAHLFGDGIWDIAEWLLATVLLGHALFCGTKGATTVFARMLSPIGKRHRKSALALGLAVVGLVAVVAAVTVVPGLGRTAHASGNGGGGCVATTGPACSFKEHSANANFGTVSSDTCPIITTASINVFESLQLPGKTGSQSIFLFISQFDCNNNQLEGADNFDPNTGLPSFTGTIQFGGGLTTAKVNGTANMFDFVSGMSFTTTINVTWQAFGPSTTFIDSSHNRGPGLIINMHFHATDRAAEASGMVTNMDNSNIAASPDPAADINNSTGGTVLINKA
jgi:hypothetical protein